MKSASAAPSLFFCLIWLLRRRLLIKKKQTNKKTPSIRCLFIIYKIPQKLGTICCLIHQCFKSSPFYLQGCFYSENASNYLETGYGFCCHCVLLVGPIPATSQSPGLLTPHAVLHCFWLLYFVLWPFGNFHFSSSFICRVQSWHF